jgi:thiamine-phosphate pyrophosphorylase
MSGLYAIIDVDSLRARRIEVMDFARAVILAHPALIQVRAKHSSPRDTLSLLRQLVIPCRQAGVRLFANDRPDLALLAECDGVHIGQDDLEIEEVRRVAPKLGIGVSTHDLAQLEAALGGSPEYVALGPVFVTQSKARPDAEVGLEALERAAERARAKSVPLVAIGGIDLARAPSVARFASMGAVIGALLPKPGEPMSQVTESARELHVALGGKR